MRILSQTGLHEGIIDVPYEQVSIEQKGNEIWLGYFATLDKHCVGKCFATYSTVEKAQKAMEMLREKYSNYQVVLNLYYELKLRTKMDKKEFYDTVSESNYFQFPADDEIEV